MSRYCALAGAWALIKSVDSVSQTLAPARAAGENTLRGGTLCAGDPIFPHMPPSAEPPES